VQPKRPWRRLAFGMRTFGGQDCWPNLTLCSEGANESRSGETVEMPLRGFAGLLARAQRVEGMGRKNADADQCEERDNEIHDATFLLAAM
jgi:hypothetical protein